MRGRFLLALPLIAAALGDAFGQTAAPACGGTQKPSAVAELLFGRKIGGGGVVSEARWSHFVDQEITSRFPGGLSMMDIKGQWRDP